MSVTVTEDPVLLHNWLTPLLELDPVRGTLLGTVRAGLGPGAWGASDGDGSLAVRSGPAYPVVVAGPWPPAERDRLRALLVALPQVRALGGPADIVTGLSESLPGRADPMPQALYRLDELREPVVPGRAELAGPAERPLAHDWFAAFLADVFEDPRPGDATIESALDGRYCWLWRDDTATAVSMACRRPVIDGSARVGPVYTPPQHRGHGYGSAVTAAATRSILDEDAVPVLFTDLANPTSNKIYRQLGYYPIAERVTITFR